MRLRLSSWRTALIGIVVIKAVLSLAVKPGSFLVSYSGISYLLLLLLATIFAIRNGIQNTLGSRIFWFFIATGYGFWTLNQYLQLHYELGLHAEVPQNSIADTLLFFHVVPFMAVVATFPWRDGVNRKLSRVVLESFFVLLFWASVFAYGVLPYQYWYSTSSYGVRFDILYLAANLAVVLAAGILTLRVEAPWKRVCLHLFGASILYGIGSAVSNLAIDAGGYVNGKLYGLCLTASVCWFVWIPLQARQRDRAEATTIIPNEGHSARPSLWPMVMVVMISVPIFWELLRRNENAGLRILRLFVAVAIIVCLASAAYIKEYLAGHESLRASEQRFRLAVQAGRMYSFEWDVITDEVVRSPEHAKVLGSTAPLSSTHRQFVERVYSDDRPGFIATIAGLTPEKPTAEVIYRVRSSAGSLIWLRSSGRGFFDSDGKLLRVIGMAADITDFKRAEEALLRHAAIVESSDDGISSVTLDGVTEIWNAGAQRMFGYTANETVGKPATIIVPPELRDQQRKILETLWAGGRIEQFETVRVSKTGKRIDVSLSISPVKDSTGKIVGCAGIARDITKRKRDEEALLSSEQRYRLLFEKNVAGVGIVSLDGRVLDCNDSWAQILGYQSRDEIRGRFASEFYFNPAEREPLVDELFDKQKLVSREVQLKHKDGSPVWVLFNSATLHIENGKTILQGTMIDISKWKRAEEVLSGMTRKLVEAQEQERSRIARELHDDIGQRLALLAFELQRLQHSPSEVQTGLQELQKQMDEISTDIQTLSHDLHSYQLEYLGIVAGMKSWCRQFAERQRIEIDYRHNVQSTVPPEIGLCFFRVLQEALHNAVKHSGVKRIEVQLNEESDAIHLIIRDLGKGFDMEAARQGKGLGLTSMRERMRLIHGTISIDSKPNRGTTIYVRVPTMASTSSTMHQTG